MKAALNVSTQKTAEVRAASVTLNRPFNSVRQVQSGIVQLQQTIGNRAVQRLWKTGKLQAALENGQPDNIYEQKVIRVANQMLQRKPMSKEIKDLEKQLQSKQLERYLLKLEMDADEERFFTDVYDERAASTLKKDTEKMKAEAQGDIQNVIPSHGLAVLRKAVEVVGSAGNVTLVVRFELTYLAMGEADSRKESAIDIPRIEKTIHDVWTVELATGRYPHTKFQIMPQVTFRQNTQKKNDKALQIIVRGEDKDPSTGTYWTGEISLAAAHLRGNRIIVIAHELYHLFGFFDTYFTMETPSAKIPGGKKKVLNVGRADQAGRGDLLGMSDPKHLKDALGRGEISQHDYDRQMLLQLHVWEEDADAILYALGVPPIEKRSKPSSDPESEDFEMQAMSELNEIKNNGEQKLKEIRRHIQRATESIDWVQMAERAIQLDEEIAVIQRRIIELKSGGV